MSGIGLQRRCRHNSKTATQNKFGLPDLYTERDSELRRVRRLLKNDITRTEKNLGISLCGRKLGHAYCHCTQADTFTRETVTRTEN